MRIKVLCEGSTEEGLRKLLAKAVDLQGCGIKIKTYEGIATLLRKLDGMIGTELSGGARVIFCLVDYHHYPVSADKQSLPFPKRLEEIKADIVARIQESRRSVVRCHVVVHEVEAWILADEQVVAQRLKIRNLSAWGQPENVNDMNPPSQVLQDLFRTRSPLKKRYDKYKDGVDLLSKVDWQKAYDKCPTFKQLVDDLRSFCQSQLAS